ncbi:hypothetical protein PR048_030433, partial [Dryococelus australis]
MRTDSLKPTVVTYSQELRSACDFLPTKFPADKATKQTLALVGGVEGEGQGAARVYTWKRNEAVTESGIPYSTTQLGLRFIERGVDICLLNCDGWLPSWLLNWELYPALVVEAEKSASPHCVIGRSPFKVVGAVSLIRVRDSISGGVRNDVRVGIENGDDDKYHRNARAEETEIPEKTHGPVALSSTIPICKHLGVTLLGLEPGLPRRAVATFRWLGHLFEAASNGTLLYVELWLAVNLADTKQAIARVNVHLQEKPVIAHVASHNQNCDYCYTTRVVRALPPSYNRNGGTVCHQIPTDTRPKHKITPLQHFKFPASSQFTSWMLGSLFANHRQTDCN